MKRALLILPLLVLGAVILQLRNQPAPPAEQAGKTERPTADWKSIRAELEPENLSGRIDETSAYGRYLQSLEKMDGPELIAAWEDLKTADLTPPVRDRLEPALMGNLIRKDPEIALSHFRDHVGERSGDIGPQLFGAFRDLAERLPLKAAKWLDESVAAGKLDPAAGSERSGDPPVRITYEREMVRALLTSSPGQAEDRLMALPEPWRATTLTGADTPLNQRAYAALVRKLMPEDAQLREFSRMASSAAYHGGMEEVTRLLDRIDATAEEREAVLRQTTIPPGSGTR